MVTQLKVLIAVVLFALGLATGWAVNGWRKNTELAELRQERATELRQIAEKTAKAVTAVRAAEKASNDAISAADQKSTKRIAQNEEETSRLRECVRLGTCGVRIVTRVVRESGSSGAADSSPGSVGHAAVELDQDVQQRVLDLKQSIEHDAEKLDYLQRYAEVCQRAGVEAMK